MTDIPLRVLVVDDNEAKRNRIRGVLSDAVGAPQLDLKSASSVAAAGAMLESHDFDLLILDLNLPMRDGESPVKDGGMRLLRTIVRGGPRLRRPKHIVGLTEFEDLFKESESEMESESWQLLHYAFDSSAWQDVLGRKAVYITGTLAGMRSDDDYQTDLAIITALKEIELDAVLSLPCEWKSLRRSQDDTYYYEGRIETEGGPLKVVCCAAIEMGMAATACLATKVIYNFSPRYLAMAGITAGMAGNFGDVIFADQSWDYGAGKVINSSNAESVFKPGPNYIAVDAELKEKAQHFKQTRSAILHEIESRWQGNTPSSRLNLSIGPVASGAAVVESQEMIDAIRTHNRKLIGVEMEVYGSFLACRTARAPRPKCFAAKSICDFGAPPKTDEYQKYAAFTSAQFVLEFAKHYLR